MEYDISPPAYIWMVTLTHKVEACGGVLLCIRNSVGRPKLPPGLSSLGLGRIDLLPLPCSLPRFLPLPK